MGLFYFILTFFSVTYIAIKIGNYIDNRQLNYKKYGNVTDPEIRKAIDHRIELLKNYTVEYISLGFSEPDSEIMAGIRLQDEAFKAGENDELIKKWREKSGYKASSPPSSK